MAARWCRFWLTRQHRLALRHAIAGVALAAFLLGSTAPARADAVGHWSRIAADAAQADGADLGHAAHTLATVHAAMFEAIVHLGGPDMAAYQVLVHTFLRQAKRLNTELGQSLAAGDAPPIPAAVVLTRSVAEIVWAVCSPGQALAGQARHDARFNHRSTTTPTLRPMPRAWQLFRHAHARGLNQAGAAALPLIERVWQLVAWPPAPEEQRVGRRGQAQTIAVAVSP